MPLIGLIPYVAVGMIAGVFGTQAMATADEVLDPSASGWLGDIQDWIYDSIDTRTYVLVGVGSYLWLNRNTKKTVNVSKRGKSLGYTSQWSGIDYN